jgi:hypothetical protein
MRSIINYPSRHGNINHYKLWEIDLQDKQEETELEEKKGCFKMKEFS